MHPSWDSPEREAAREEGRERLRAELRGHQLAELRRQSELTQAEVAARMGVSQARVSQIESGQITSMDSVRDYVGALGGSLDVVATVGGWSVKVA
ncbi:helix-turn-helix domain-containing protein [Nocardiopsis sp. RSe5-2]|uniref:Helix-turn-helix domain-containing protein n=1 Tax=Nocardiopsis endophytica TaxID=3018445 RepID=A0ABT4U253_9ACTN|nr:helix-turn-helix domain-containing protein [Nocardiopsis endophytica]MDA2811012.1 helix-turn-helix domain-containing protein [Nocardiopsis endophytica]